MKPPLMDGYKPFGIPRRELETVVLQFEELEAIRLADYEHLYQEEAAKKMGVSRPTFTRLLDSARTKLAKALMEGRAILFKGGAYITDDYWYKCHNCNERMVALKRLNQCRTCESDEIIQLSRKPE